MREGQGHLLRRNQDKDENHKFASDELRSVHTCQEWLAMNYKTQAAVTKMVTFSGLLKRSLMCRIAKATGMPPLDYIHAHRLEEAKQLLETTDLPVEAFANEVGYEDTSFFGQLFRRKAEITRCSIAYGLVRCADFSRAIEMYCTSAQGQSEESG